MSTLVATKPKVKDKVRYFPIEGGLYHIYDPTTSRHFKLGAQEVGWLKALDGSRTHPELVGVIPLEYFEDFFRNLDRMSLLEGAQAKRERFDPLKIKVFKIDPSRLLRTLEPFARGYRIALNVVTWPVLFLNICLFAAIVQGAPGMFPPAQKVLASLHFGFATVAIYLVAIVIIGAVHELSHGVVASSYGVAVPSFGFMFLVLNPAFYADVSGINNLASRHARIQVLSAGMKANNLMMFGGIFLYLRTIGSFESPYLLVFIAFNFILCIVNIIPFVSYDGYYIFQELIGEPRYAARAFSAALGRQGRRVDYTIYTLIAFSLRFALVFLAVNGARKFAAQYWGPIYVNVAAFVLLAVIWGLVARRALQQPTGARG